MEFIFMRTPMSQVYCAYCSALISDQDDRCGTCRRKNLRRETDPRLGLGFVTIIVATMITAVYGRLIYVMWPRWEKIFTREGQPPQYAEEAAMLLGILVFFASAFLTIMVIRPQKAQ
jgi:uncharacterized membrane protein YidH (DUF202 family)